MSKFLVLLSISALFYASSACNFGYFTNTSPCDTQALAIPDRKYVSTSIEPGQWAYFYIPLGGIENNIDLYFKVDGPSPDGYLTFQPDSSDHLPTDSDSYYEFYVQWGTQEMPALKKINGITSFDDAIMILGLYNRDSFKTNLEITYFTEDEESDGSSTLRKLIVGIIIGVIVAASLLFCMGGYSMWMVRRLGHRSATAIQTEAQRIFQNNNKVDEDHLSLEDLQKYFPKKPFKDFENPFQQAGCSVCLEDFVPDTSCHQLYCNHIFHETCVEIWLEKHSSCPGCRVSIGKKAIEEFLKKQRENNDSKSIEIKIQNEQSGQ